MYHVLLTNRYLTMRVIPLIAVAAVGLCVALVIIVVSVMTGFLDMVKNSGQTLMGHVVVSYPTTGIPRYERLIERIEALPEAKAATAVIDDWGLLKMPYPDGRHKQTEKVQFWAVEPEGFAAVTGYAETLYWRPATEEERAEQSPEDFRRLLGNELDGGVLARVLEQGLILQHRDESGRITPGATLGMHVSTANERQRDGSYRPIRGPVGYWWMPRFEVVLTALPVDTAAVSPEPESAVLRVVNEFVSGVFLIDDMRIIVPLEVGQRLLHLDEAVRVDDEGEETGLVDPARATMILVRARDGVTPDELRDRVSEAFRAFREEFLADESLAVDIIPPTEGFGLQILTWLQQQAQFIRPIEKERSLMRVLFSITYLVCAGLVLAIFWAIVYEKTRDIGILRSIGASRSGITLIFLRYGGIVGLLGSLLGVGLAYVIVNNINEIHSALGEPAPRWLWITTFVLAAGAALMTLRSVLTGLLLPVVLWTLATIVLAPVAVALMLHRGTLLWDASVYYFSEIPNDLDLVTVGSTVIGAVLFSVLGAFIPAARAADTDPVKALRYE